MRKGVEPVFFAIASEPRLRRVKCFAKQNLELGGIYFRLVESNPGPPCNETLRGAELAGQPCGHPELWVHGGLSHGGY